MQKLLTIANKELIANWCTTLKIPTFNISDTCEDIFDYFIKITSKINDFAFDDSTCLALLNKNIITIYSAPQNEMIITTYDIKDQNKWQMKLSNFHFIITNFAVPTILEELNTCLRYEIIVNYFSGYKSHYFNKNFYSSKDDYSIFLKKQFVNALCCDSTSKLIKLIHYGSKLLNNYDKGMIDGNGDKIKQTINISEYGRWYVHKSNFNIQLDKVKKEELVFSYLKNKYVVYNLDMFSAEPYVLYDLSNIRSIKDLIEIRRNSTNQNEIEFIKFFLNIYIHSKMSTSNIINYLKQKITIDFDISAFKCFFDDLDDNMIAFNSKILEKYKKNLACIEGYRRIVNPFIPFIDKKDAIKEHRKYHCAHVIDSILLLAVDIFKKSDMIPVYLLHDEIMYAVKKEDDRKFYTTLTETIEATNKPIKIEKRERTR